MSTPRSWRKKQLVTNTHYDRDSRFLSLLALLFIELHGPTGQTLYVNAAEISMLREPTAQALAAQHWAKGVHCIIVQTNGKFLAVAEDCATVRSKLEK